MKGTRTLLIALALSVLCSVASAAVDPYSFEPPVSKDYNMPYTITVYLSRQMVVAFDAATMQPVRYMICSSGLSNPTPRFNVTIPGTVVQPWAVWGNVYVRYPTRIKGSYYFHSILYKTKTSYDTVAWNALGRRASHGCVRMTPLDAQWISYNCKKGTRVRIVSQDTSGLNLGDKHDEIKRDLNKFGIESVQPTLKPTPTPPPPDLDRNSTQAKLIKSFQKKLREHGFYNAALSGVFDQATEDAWNEYQSRQGWTVDGVATTEEQAFLTTDEKTIAYHTDLKLGSTGIIVKFVEERLKALGFYNGTPNKGYDSVTVAAVKKYQKSVGLTPNGKLYASQQPDFFSGEVPAPTPDPGLTIGSSGAKVKKLQNRLYTLGFFASPINGKYASTTQSAVKAFQKAAGLTETGNADSETHNLILTSDLYVGTARTLNVGSKGVVVKAAEEKLAKLGFYAMTPDLIYDKNTYLAVKLFQEKSGLNQTGVANPETLIALFAA